MVSTSIGVRKGSWTEEEDNLLKKCIDNYGEGKWHLVPLRAGLNRCRKSCRLRWLNYLRPNIKRGDFTQDEDDLILRLHKLLGNRWSLISGRLPGRTANDVKNHWNTHLQKKVFARGGERSKAKTITESTILKPRPRTFKRAAPVLSNIATDDDKVEKPSPSSPKPVDDECVQWWNDLLCSVELDEDTEPASNGMPIEFHEEDNDWSDFSLDKDIWKLLSSENNI